MNPDNAIFVENDTEEDINNLAYDIEKNGLLHNLVVFEVMEKNAEGRGEKRAYMLLSGERRYKAIKKLKLESLPIKQLWAAVLSQRG